MIFLRKHKHVFKRDVLRYPRLDTVLMIEERVRKSDRDFGVRELWLKLPKKVMWQTFLAALDYLEYSGKIAVEENKRVSWVFVPAEKSQFKSRHIAVVSAGEVKPFFNPFFA